MSDVDAFVGGGGRLGDLLRRLPAFEPPAHMEARFVASLPTPALPAEDGIFEAPASLEAAVFKEAVRLDAAQAPRRQAVIDEIARRGAEATLGAPLSPQGQRWIDGQLPTPPTPRPRRRQRRWFAPLGGALAATLALGVALQLVWAPPRTAPPVLPPASMPPSILHEASPLPLSREAREQPAELAKRRASAPAAREPMAAEASPQAPKAEATLGPRQQFERARDAAEARPDAERDAPPRRVAAPLLADAPERILAGKPPPLAAASPAQSAAGALPRASKPAPAGQAITSDLAREAGPRPPAPASRQFGLDDVDGMARWIIAAPVTQRVWQLTGSPSSRTAIERVSARLTAHPVLRERQLSVRVEWADIPRGDVLLAPIRAPH